MKSVVRVVLCVALTSVIGACSQPSEPMGEAGQAAAQQPAAPASTAPAVDMVSKQVVADQLPSIPGVGEIRGDSLVSTGKEGFLIFGPYVAVEAGTYTLAIKGSVNEVPAGSIKLDVVSNLGKTSHGERSVSQPGELPSFEITLPAMVNDLEVRVQVPEGARVAVSSYQLTRTP